jgi:putative Holliday junction resolvase
MGLDVGDKTIGVAVSDPFGWTAQGVEVIRRNGWSNDFRRLIELRDQYEVSEWVVGYPINMNGTIGSRATLCKAFADQLQERFSQPVHLIDERLTTVAAERLMISADVSRQKRKQKIDQVAATLILQLFLDARPKG